MPQFSILLPAHNRADIIGFSIRSILAQTRSDFELLVVGDGCTDNTAEVVTSFRDDRIRWIDLPKAPFSGYANRNVGLREARGELIVYAQHDDLMLPDHLALIDELMQPEIVWAYTRPLWVTTDGIVVPFGTNLLISGELRYFLETGNSIPSCCVVHRRSCFDRSGYWPEDIAQAADYEFWKKIIRDHGADRIGYLPSPTTLHFSASWKNSRYAGTIEVLTWLRAADRFEWWPAAFRYSVADGEKEQSVLFDAMQRGGSGFVRALRDATIAVMDRQAWDAVRRLIPELETQQERLAENQRQLEQFRHRIAELESQLGTAGLTRTGKP